MSMALKVLGSFFRAMTGAYALNLLLYLLLYFMIGESWVVVAFFNSFIHLMILLALVLLPICLLMREWRISAMILPSLIFFGFIWGPLFMPNDVVMAEENEIPLRVLSYNMRSNGRDSQMIIDLIRSTDADIVALQELGAQDAEAIEIQLSDIYPYMALHPGQHPTQGLGILSRYPLSDDAYWQYDFLLTPLGHQHVYIEDLSLTLYNLHPTHPAMNGHFFNPSYRSREIADVLEQANAEEEHVILLGDFNMPDLSDDYRAIRNHYQDAFWETGQGMGWTFTLANSPAFLRLDYLFYRGEIRAVSAEVLDDRAGSDHYPLLVDLLLSND